MVILLENSLSKVLAAILIFNLYGVLSYGQNGMHYGAKETFNYWAGEDPWEGIQVLNGQYWCSDHWTKEYVMYMEVKVPVKMALSFITDNGLHPTHDSTKYPTTAPKWFKPPNYFKEYKAGNYGSKYFIYTKTGHMFIYEVQL